MAASESISVTLSSASVSSVKRELKNPFVIEVMKSPVIALFPLTYKQDFNNQPRERMISTSLFSCDDGYYGDSQNLSHCC